MGCPRSRRLHVHRSAGRETSHRCLRRSSTSLRCDRFGGIAAARARGNRRRSSQASSVRADLVELTRLDPTIKLDIRYATSRNFLGNAACTARARAFLQRPAARKAVGGAVQACARRGGLRPAGGTMRIGRWYVTKIFWDATPADKPTTSSQILPQARATNRGCAVDLTLYDFEDGAARPRCPACYDEMSERGHIRPIAGGTAEQTPFCGDLLRRPHGGGGPYRLRITSGGTSIYRDWKSYAIQNVRFEAIAHEQVTATSGVSRTRPLVRAGALAPWRGCLVLAAPEQIVWVASGAAGRGRLRSRCNSCARNTLITEEEGREWGRRMPGPKFPVRPWTPPTFRDRVQRAHGGGRWKDHRSIQIPGAFNQAS